ncbi:MAG: hypothetical protein NZ530_06850 [Thermodesulfobacteriaceae bacterium]|nr:hypothetical protein [Thermodesulfobacteriaceae bacterium]MCX8041443.1 hypothetical protein [Thermodesulfobacteriaceae bacterium]MDW8135774.1 hypothetical protein [Thermodesulfobacterium sp.]
MFLFLILLTIILLCGCSSKFDLSELSKLGKIAITSESSYQIVYVPSPFAKDSEKEEIVGYLENILEEFPLAQILRQKIYNAMTSAYTLNLVDDSVVEKLGKRSLQDFIFWAKKNNLQAIIHLESIIEISHVYRIHSLPLKNYPKIWTKVKIIKVESGEIIWIKRVWTHMFDGTIFEVKSSSVYGNVVERKELEFLIHKKIDYIVNSILKSFTFKHTT